MSARDANGTVPVPKKAPACDVCRRRAKAVAARLVVDGGAKVHTQNGVEVDAIRVVTCSDRCARAAVFGFGPAPRGSSIKRAKGDK